jgi:hypothetical protein
MLTRRTARPRRRAAARPGVVAGVAVVLLALAGWLFVRLGGVEAAPADEFLGFYCPHCKHSTQVSHRDFERRFERREYRTVAGGQFALQCPVCRELRARRADTPADIAALDAQAGREAPADSPPGTAPPPEDRPGP